METNSILADDGIYSGRYAVKAVMRDRICGGVPKDPEIQIKWLETKGFSPQEAREYVEQMRSDSDSTEEFIDDQVTKAWSGFKSDDTGLFIEARQVRAMLREGATELGLTSDRKKGMRQRLQHGTFVKPDRIYVRNGNGGIAQAPSGWDSSVVHAMTPKGKIAAFKRFDYVKPAAVEFEVWIVRAEKFTESDLRRMLALAQEQGLGSNRSQGEGKFDVVEFEEL